MPRKHIWARPKRDRCDHISQLGRVISPRTCHRLLVPTVRTPTSLFHKGAQTAAAVPLRPDFNMHDTHPTSTSMHIDERGRQGGRKVIPKQSRLPRRQRQRPGSRSAATCADSRRDRRAGGAGALIPLQPRKPHVCANARMPDLGMADVRLLLPVHDIGVRAVGPAHRPTAVSVLKVAMPSTEYREEAQLAQATQPRPWPRAPASLLVPRWLWLWLGRASHSDASLRPPALFRHRERSHRTVGSADCRS